MDVNNLNGAPNERALLALMERSTFDTCVLNGSWFCISEGKVSCLNETTGAFDRVWTHDSNVRVRRVTHCLTPPHTLARIWTD